MSNELGGAVDQIGGAEFDFWFGTYVDMRKWLRAFGAYR